MQSLKNTVERLIDKGQTEGLAEKLDIFLLNNRLTKDEYNELLSLIQPKEA